MMHLLKIEWLKIRNYKTFWILIGIFASLYLLINYILGNIVKSANQGPIKLLDESYSFPFVWNTMAYNYSWLILFLCMFMIISLSNEYTYKTQRQHIIDGMHRVEFIHAKALLIIAISIASTLFYTILCLIFGALVGGSGMFEQAHLILYVFIYTVNYLSFAALIALFIKRTGLSIIIFLAYLMLEAGIGSYINLKLNSYFGNFLPLQVSDELLPSRSIEKLKGMANNMTMSNNAPMISFLIASIIYITLYYFVAKRKMQNSDL